MKLYKIPWLSNWLLRFAFALLELAYATACFQDDDEWQLADSVLMNNQPLTTDLCKMP